MTWLTLRRFRFELITLAVVVAALIAWMIYSGLQRYTALANEPGVVACTQQILAPQPGDVCYGILASYLNQFQDPESNPFGRGAAVFFISLLPALVGALLGAPLIARDLERGVFRLVWTQGKTRSAWLRGGVITATLATVTLVGLMTLVVMWWRAPFDAILGSFQNSFEMEGFAPVAYALFALASGIAAGLLLRSSVPAIFVTLVTYYVIHIPFGFLRALYLPPLITTYDPSQPTPANGPQLRDWIINSWFVDRAGHPVSQDVINGICGSNDPTTAGNPTSECVHAHGWLYTVTWQPDSRFWIFQGIESAIYLSMAIGLIVFVAWWVRRRLA